MSFRTHVFEVLLILADKHVSQQMTIGVNIPSHPAGLNFEKHIRSNFEKVCVIKTGLMLLDL